MTTDAREQELLAEIELLEDKVDRLTDQLEECRSPVVDDLHGQECRRCHRRFAGHIGQQWCTRDCRYGWTPAPTYEEWYATMHPRSKWLRYPNT